MQNIGRASFPSNAILKHINYSKPSLLVGNESFNSSFSGFWLLEVFLLSPLIQKNKSYHKTNLLKTFICIILVQWRMGAHVSKYTWDLRRLYQNSSVKTTLY